MVKIEEIVRPKQTSNTKSSESSHYYHGTPVEAPSLIPILPPPKWKRNVTLKDSQPDPSSSSKVGGVDGQGIDKQSSSQPSCQICHSHTARYTCPRCEIPYCSVSCYKNHNQGDTDGTNSCTEAFYQDRVTSVLDLEAKEGSKSMEEILVRSRHRELQDGLNCTGNGDEEEHGDMVNYSEEELWKLAEALEQTDLLDDDAALTKLMTPELRQAFERDIQRGQLNGVLEPWNPWWRPDLISSSSNAAEATLNSDSFDDIDGDSTDIIHIYPPRKKRTLDEKLLAVPSLQSLMGAKASLTTIKSSSILRFNLVELLYSICLTLRLYYGVDNALESSQDAALTIISSSTVLQQDAKFTSLQEVLTACTATSTQAAALDKNGSSSSSNCTGGCNAHWTILAEDVALLLDGNGNDQHRRRRYVTRALLDAIDICKLAIKSAKQEKNNKNNKDGDNDKDTTTSNIKEVRKIRKKLEFYVSWSQEAELEGAIATDIRSWIQDWELKNNNDDNDMLETLRLPPNSETNRTARQRIDKLQQSNKDGFLLAERSSRKIT